MDAAAFSAAAAAAAAEAEDAPPLLAPPVEDAPSDQPPALQLPSAAAAAAQPPPPLPLPTSAATAATAAGPPSSPAGLPSAHAATMAAMAALKAASAMAAGAGAAAPPPRLLGGGWEEPLRPLYDFGALARPGGLAALAPPLVVMPSNLASASLSSGLMTVQGLGGGPAAAAALLGPAGLPGMLAAFAPTRVLSVLNAVTDVDLCSRDTLLDLLTDIAGEAQAAVREGRAAGALVRAVAPLPRPGEALEPSVARAKAPLKHVGADGMLEDAARDEGGGGRQQALSEALVLAHEPEAKGLGQANRMRVPTAATEFFKKLGGAFSEHVVSVPDGRGAFASFTAAAPEPPEGSADGGGGGGSAHDSAMQEDGGGAAVAAAAAAAAGAQPAGPQRTRGLGRIYLEFSSIEAAVAACCALSGRFFSGHILVASFESEVAFCSGALVSLREAPGLPPGAAAGGQAALERGSLVLAGEAVEGAVLAPAPAPAAAAAAAAVAASAGGDVD